MLRYWKAVNMVILDLIVTYLFLSFNRDSINTVRSSWNIKVFRKISQFGRASAFFLVIFRQVAASLLYQFGTQVRKCLQFERHFNSGPWRQDVLYGPAQNFALCRLRPSQDSRAVGRQPAIPRSLEYRTILYKTTFVLDKLWRHVSDKNYELQRRI